MEYDSKLAHLEQEQFYYDKNRETALTASGYKVIQLTSNNVANFHAIENTFLLLRKTLGMRSRPDRMEKYFEKRWDVVNNIMFGKTDSYQRRKIEY